MQVRFSAAAAAFLMEVKSNNACVFNIPAHDKIPRWSKLIRSPPLRRASCLHCIGGLNHTINKVTEPVAYHFNKEKNFCILQSLQDG